MQMSRPCTVSVNRGDEYAAKLTAFTMYGAGRDLTVTTLVVATTRLGNGIR